MSRLLAVAEEGLVVDPRLQALEVEPARKLVDDVSQRTHAYIHLPIRLAYIRWRMLAIPRHSAASAHGAQDNSRVCKT